ncbi:hypothetical protein GCM10022393_11450 [Aquimarina addita]|uniref:Uncharacterized protein n=1 Tax=Aquimarina addita TaxID=870485 RepID=A0ABP7XDP4_9FLAO
MIKIIKNIGIQWMVIQVVFLLISCQEEERELIDPTIDDTITQDSTLAGLMKNVVTHDGSFDDLVDKGNCYSINFPYFILHNGNLKEITHTADYAEILDSDTIQIQFPVTVTTYEYKEEFIETSTELNALASSCLSDDEDIECIDFVYPFNLSTFNANTNLLNTIEVLHDAQVYKFMDEMDDQTVMSINYPIQLVLHNGDHTTSGHNEQLVATILDFIESCNEND